jgi:hypothetical protein
MNWYKISQNVNYTAVVLDLESSEKLWNTFKKNIPEDWKKYCHHMTINLGKTKKPEDLGKEIALTAYEFGIDEKAAAVKVKGYKRLDGGIEHITIAVNINSGGKPKHSNEIKEWNPCENISLNGIIKEVS